MANELATTEMIQLYALSLTPQECDEHRAWIGVRIEALLDPYWDKRPSDLVKAEIVMDWMDALQNYSPDEIRAGCRRYLSGAKRASKPKPGDIRAECDAMRADILRDYDLRMMREAAKRPVFVAPDPSPEELAQKRARAQEWVEKAGFGKRMPQ